MKINKLCIALFAVSLFCTVSVFAAETKIVLSNSVQDTGRPAVAAPGGLVRATFDYTNTTGNAAEPRMVLTYYNADNRLESVSVSPVISVGNGVSVMLETGFILPSGAKNGDKVRAFALENLASLKPLSAVAELTVQGISEDFPHPIMTPKYGEAQLASLQASVADIMALSDAALLEIVPKQATNIEEVHPLTGNTITPQWSPNTPEQFTDTTTGTVFPGIYAMTKTEYFTNIRGQSVPIPYYKNAAGKKYYFGGVLDTCKKKWLVDQLERLGCLYRFTGDSAYAHKIAIVLNRWADYLPGYLCTLNTTVTYTSVPYPLPAPPALPFNWYAARFDRRWCQEISEPLLFAYDAIYNSPVLDNNAREHINRNFFREMADFTLMYPWENHMRNNLVTHVRGWIYVGRVTGAPDYVHRAFKYIKESIEQYSFTRDGLFGEGSSYMSTYLNTLGDVFTPFDGYVDPDAAPNPISGVRINGDGRAQLAPQENFINVITRDTIQDLMYPDGSIPHISDTRGYEYLRNPLSWIWWTGAPNISAPNASKNVLKDGWGHAILGGGNAQYQTQAHLHYADDKYVHSHSDSMSLMLNALGRQMFDDIGYTHTIYRRWTNLTLSHNTVVIDRKNQDASGDSTNPKGNAKGNVTMYYPSEDAPLIQVDGRNVYENTPEIFRRTLALNIMDEKTPYLVDIFEVKGGTRHDYVLHGSRSHEQNLLTDVPVAPMAGERPLLESGETWVEPVSMSSPISGNGYGAFTEVKSGQVNNDFYTDFQYVEPYKDGAFYDPRLVQSENFCLNKPVTIGGTYYAAYPPENMTDGKDTSYFAMRIAPFWTSVDFGETKKINRINIKILRNWTNFEFSVSTDGVNYSPVYTDELHGGMLTEGTHTLRFDDVDARYLKVAIPASYNPSTGAPAPPLIYELKAYCRFIPEEEINSSSVGVRTHFLTPGASTLYLAKSPAVKQNAFSDNTNIASIKSEALILRRNGAAPLSSLYAAVHEPYMNSRHITGVKKLPAVSAQNVAALKISMDTRSDIVFVSLDGDGLSSVTDGSDVYTTDGRYFVVSADGNGTRYRLFGGTYLNKNGTPLLTNAAAKYTGAVTGVQSAWDGAGRNAVITDTALPLGGALAGKYLILKLGVCSGESHPLGNLAYTAAGTTTAYEISGVSYENGKYVIELSEETGLRINGSVVKEIFAQRRIFNGFDGFEIYL